MSCRYIGPRLVPLPVLVSDAAASSICQEVGCFYASDGVCDDGGSGAEYSECSFGNDCTDCGVRYGASPDPTCWIDTAASVTPPFILIILVVAVSLVRTVAARLREDKAPSSGLWRTSSTFDVLKQHFREKLTLTAVMATLFPALYVIGIAMCPTPIQTRQDHRFAFTYLSLSFAVTPFLGLVLGSVRAAREHKKVLARLAEVEKGKYVATDGSVQDGSLEDVLKFGTITLLSVDWLLAPKDEKGVLVEVARLPRQQDLPKRAVVKENEAVKLLRAGKVAALSYRWLERHHPDPEGWHLRALRKFFEKDAHRRWTAMCGVFFYFGAERVCHGAFAVCELYGELRDARCESARCFFFVNE